MNNKRQLERLNRNLQLGWKALTLNSGRVYFINFITRKSQWYPPPPQWSSAEKLPYGWERAQDQSGNTYYISHIMQITTSDKPLPPHRKKTSMTTSILHKDMRHRTYTEGKLRVQFERAVDIKHFEQSNAFQDSERMPTVDGIFRVHLYSEHISSSFKISQKLTIEGVKATLCERFEIHPENHRYFAIMKKEDAVNYLHFITPETKIEDLTLRPGYKSSEFYFRMVFIPADVEALRKSDANTYNYLFHQTRRDIKDGRFAEDITLELAIDIGIVLHQYHLKLDEDRYKKKAKSKSKLDKDIDQKTLENIIPIKNVKVKDFKRRWRRTLEQVKDFSCEELKSYVMRLCGNIRNFGGQYYKLNSSSGKIVKLLIGRNCGINEIVHSNYRSMNRLAWFQQVSNITVRPTGKLSYQLEIRLNSDKLHTFSATKSVALDVARMIDGYSQIIDKNTISLTKFEANSNFPQSIIQETTAPIPGYHSNHCLYPESWSYIRPTNNDDETYMTDFNELPKFNFEALSNTGELPKRHPTYPPPDVSLDDSDVIHSNFKMAAAGSPTCSTDTLDMDISTPSSSTSSPISPLISNLDHEIRLNSDLSACSARNEQGETSNPDVLVSPKIFTNKLISTELDQGNTGNKACKRNKMTLPTSLAGINIIPSPLASPAPGRPFDYKDIVLPPPSPFADGRDVKANNLIHTMSGSIDESDDEVYL